MNVLISACLMGVYCRYNAEQVTMELLITEHEKHPDNPYMLPSPATRQMYSPYVLSRLHKKILKAAGLEYLRFHDLRHTAATMLIHAGLNVRAVVSRMGHANPNVTLQVYSHALQSSDKEAANIMQELTMKKDKSVLQIQA